MSRPRIWVVLAGGFAGAGALFAAIVAYAVIRAPGGQFADTFVFNLLQSQPVIGPIVEADPSLHKLMLTKTQQGYLQGGWPAATRVFWQIADSEIAAYANDQTTLDCAAAWQKERRSLLNDPHLCRALLNRLGENPSLQPHLTTANTVCEAAMIDGGKRRMTRTAPDVMSDADYATYYARTSSANNAAASPDDRIACQVAIEENDRLLALPPDIAARMLRTVLHNEARQKLDTQPRSPEPATTVVETPPPDLHCAAPGTVFTLSMHAADGLPVTWQSLGQKGWDCQLRSSVSGERGMWVETRDNPLQLLWPLAPGKTAKTSFVRPGGEDWATTWRVSEEANYWVPWGRAHAFAIEADVRGGDGSHYTFTSYWSPELGFQIGHRSQSIEGDMPQGMAPDWQAIAMDEAPRSLDGRGTSLTRKQAAEDIHYALTRAEAVHPHLYWNADRRRVLARADALITALPEPATAMDVYLALAELAGMLGDGHVALTRPSDQHGDVLSSYLHAGGGLLVATLDHPTNTGLKLYWSRTEGVAAGDVLTRINGLNAKDLFASMQRLEPGEPAFKERNVLRDFPSLLWDLGVRPPFVLDGVFANVPGHITTKGWTQPAGSAPPTREDDDGLTLKELPNSIFLLGLDRMTGPRTRFRQHLERIFTQLSKEHATGLVVDLRTNGGGSTERGEDLLAYITDKPRRASARREFRASAECRNYFAANLPVDELGEAVKTLADGASKSWDYPVASPPANALRFTGTVAVLIGPGTFSAANMLANEIADFHLATLIGRDTAEISNNYGMACPVRLPHTGMELLVPSTYFARANGDEISREDVHPDLRVPRPKDLPAGEDVDLEAARRWLLSRLNTNSASK
jgi:hypothetical protein